MQGSRKHDTKRMQRFLRRAAVAALAAVALLPRPVPAERIEQEGLVADGLAPAPATLATALGRYQKARSARLLDWLADGSLLIAPRFGGPAQAHRVAAPLAMREQLSFVDATVDAAAAHPFDPRRFAFRAHDTAGHAWLALQRIGDGAAQALTDATAHDDPPLWAHDGRRLAFASDRRGGGEFDVYVIDTGSGDTPRLVLGGGGRWRVLDWSRDDLTLLVQHDGGTPAAGLYRVEIASGRLTPVEPPTAARAATPRVAGGRFSPDGRAVLYLAADTDGFLRLREAPIDGSPARELAAAPGHDIERFDVSADGRYLAYAWDEAGISRLQVVDQRGRLELAPPANLPAGIICALRFDRAGARLALEIETATAPADVYVLEPASGQFVRWTQSELGPLDAAQLVPAIPFRFRTWDRVDGRLRGLGGFVYAPRTAGHHPVLVLLHDGPDGCFRPGFDPWLQFLVNELGIAVVAPNLRGSGGAGRAFAALDDGLLREDPLRDVGSLLVWIGLQPGLDPGRVVLFGRGAGADQALAALAQYGDRLRGAVALAPHASLLALADAADAAGDPDEYGAPDEERQRALLQRLSPLSLAAEILRPVLLVDLDGQATADPPGDAEQILWRMRVNRREAALLRLDGRRCGGDCDGARDGAWAAIAGWLQGALAAP